MIWHGVWEGSLRNVENVAWKAPFQEIKIWNCVAFFCLCTFHRLFLRPCCSVLYSFHSFPCGCKKVCNTSRLETWENGVNSIWLTSEALGPLCICWMQKRKKGHVRKIHQSERKSVPPVKLLIFSHLCALQSIWLKRLPWACSLFTMALRTANSLSQTSHSGSWFLLCYLSMPWASQRPEPLLSCQQKQILKESHWTKQCVEIPVQARGHALKSSQVWS